MPPHSWVISGPTSMPLRRKVLTLELPPGAALSENELAAVLGPTLIEDLRANLEKRLGLYDAQSPDVFAAQHVEIFAAVCDGDTGQARTAMRTHLRAVFEDIERIRARSPELFASGPATVPNRRERDRLGMISRAR